MGPRFASARGAIEKLVVGRGTEEGTLWRILRDKITRAELGIAIFSDTILLWTKDEEPESLDALLEVCNLLMCVTLQRDVMPLAFRIGVAFGEVWIDQASSIYMGPGIVRAYLCEQKQDWMGGAVDLSVSDGLLERIDHGIQPRAMKRTVLHDVPLHDRLPDVKLTRRRAGGVASLKWPLYAAWNEDGERFIEQCFEELADSAEGSARRKIESAWTFFRQHRRCT